MHNDFETVWERIERRGPDECWLWLGYKNPQGYGRLDMFGIKGIYAHRAAYLKAHPGSISLKATDKEKMVLHTCDNPSCCNPAHLYLGSHAQNMRDKTERGRAPNYKGDFGPRCKLTMEDVFWIRLHKRYGTTRRALAELYGVSLQTIKAVWSGRHYQETS